MVKITLKGSVEVSTLAHGGWCLGGLAFDVWLLEEGCLGLEGLHVRLGRQNQKWFVGCACLMLLFGAGVEVGND